MERKVRVRTEGDTEFIRKCVKWNLPEETSLQLIWIKRQTKEYSFNRNYCSFSSSKSSQFLCFSLFLPATANIHTAHQWTCRKMVSHFHTVHLCSNNLGSAGCEQSMRCSTVAYQQASAVPEPSATILSSQHEGEGLTVKRMWIIRLFTNIIHNVIYNIIYCVYTVYIHTYTYYNIV